MSPPTVTAGSGGGSGGEVNKSVLGLISSQPDSWIRAGYLMLRMKLPNNRYAWSFIVSSVCGGGAG